MFLENIELHANRILLECEDGSSYSYADALELSLCLKDTARRLVFCLCDNTVGGILGYVGLMAANAVVVMLPAKTENIDLSNLIKIYQPKFIWAPADRLPDLSGASLSFGRYEYSLFQLKDVIEVNLHEDLALLVSTSGTTGSPKMVRLSKDNLVANANSISKYLSLNANEVPITTLPPSYTYGFSIINSHLLHGCKIALTGRSFIDRLFWEFLKSSGATSLSGVPYHYEMMHKLHFAKMELPSLKTLTQAGGHLSESLVLEYANLCAHREMRFYVMYGQTEASPRMSYLPLETALLKPGSIGKPLPGGKFWLLDDAGNHVSSSNVEGELVYQGRNVCLGYALGHSDLAKGDEFGGILKTGDLASYDEDGDYYIVGRLNRFIKLFGFRVNLHDIENYLLSIGFVAACTGEDDRLEIYVCGIDNVKAKLIRASLAARYRLNPKGIKIFNSHHIPRNDSGKIQYSLIAKFANEVVA